jgi:hypothetical protein
MGTGLGPVSGSGTGPGTSPGTGTGGGGGGIIVFGVADAFTEAEVVFLLASEDIDLVDAVETVVVFLLALVDAVETVAVFLLALVDAAETVCFVETSDVLHAVASPSRLAFWAAIHSSRVAWSVASWTSCAWSMRKS